MIPVAVVLIVLVIVFTVALIIGNPQSFDLQIFTARIPANITGVYVTGAITMVVLGVAGWLLWTGFVRLRAQQKEIRSLKAAAAGTEAIGSRKGGPGGAAGKSPAKSSSKGTSTAQGDEKSSATKATPAESKPSSKETSDPSGPKSRSTDKSDSADRDDKSDRGDKTDSADKGAAEVSAEKDHEPKREPGDQKKDSDSSPMSAEERRRLLAEADEITRDDP